MIYYILQIVAFQVLFLLIYDLFLKKETFFNYNRAYLLITALLSFVLPFIKIHSLRTLAPTNFTINLPEIIIGSINQSPAANKVLTVQLGNQQSVSIWSFIMILGVVVMTIVFCYKLIKIVNLKFKNPGYRSGSVLIVRVLKSNTAFSFFNMVFLGESITKQQQDIILKHELVHVKHYHTIDLLIFETMRIFLWFNPLIYMYQNRIKALHEYVADKAAVKNNDKKKYYEQLLNQVFDTKNTSFINTFFNKSLIKKRIIMLQKSKSKNVNALKYALLIPMVFGMLFYVSCEKDVNTNELDSEIDLSQYSYELSMKNGTLTPETKEIHREYESFLRTNKDYVSWMDIDIESQVITYSIHSKEEKVPEGYKELSINSPNGDSYLTYMNLGSEVQKKSKKTKKLNPRDFDGKLEVPFSVIDKAPSLSSCQNTASLEEHRKCVEQEIAKFISKNFNIGLAKTLGLPDGIQKIYTIFKINTEGNIIDIRARAPHPDLETEAQRVIGQLPKFIPGEHNGKKVIVAYSLPITFQIKP